MTDRLGITAEPKKHLLLRIKTKALDVAGWCLEKLKAPARLKPFEFIDPASDETVYLYTSKRYSVLCVGERRFYFDRINGKFDGFSAPASLVPDWVEFAD
jgi:hypothetical protein